MEMTLAEYANNPMGKRNSVFGNREMYRELYTEKLDKILVRETGKIDYTLYTNKDEYIVHFKIPSEVVPNFYYDTVILFYTTDSAIVPTRTLKDYNVKFYSNDPSFVYTFAHAFLENDLFIRDLVPRMSREAIKRVATEKNPRNEVGYVKSIYFAYLLCIRYGLFNKVQFETYGSKYNKSALLSNIMHADDKIESRRTGEEKLRKENKKENTRKKTEARKDMSFVAKSADIISRVSSNTGFARTSKIVGKAKKTKRI